MAYRNVFLATLVAAACLAPPAAFADEPQYIYNYEISLGAMGVWGSNPEEAGRYNGLNTSGLDLIGQFSFGERPALDSEGTWYYDATGNNLIFQTNDLDDYASGTRNNLANDGSLDFKLGQQGTWAVQGYFNSISYTGNIIDSLYTVDGGQATLNPGLTPWAGATIAVPGTIFKTAAPALNRPALAATGAMLPLQTGTRRDIAGGDFKYILGDWTFSGAFRHEHKEGSMEESWGGPWGGTAFALPIDYDTDRYDATVAYSTRVTQLSLQYTYSHFQDENSFVNLPYPFSATVVPYQLSSAYSTPPSSSAHYLTLMAGTNAVPDTRINVNLRGGLELQDDTFAPDSADPNIQTAPGFGNLNSHLQGTDNSALNGVAEVLQGKISITSHPIANLDASAFYSVDGRWINLDESKVYTGNTGGFGDASFNNVQYVVPQEWLKNSAGAEVGYRIIPEYDTKLKVGYRFDAVDRNNAQVNSSITHTATAALSTMIGSQLYANLSYEYADRNGSLSYSRPWTNLDGSYTATYSGAYYQAPMTSNAVKLMGSYSPAENLSLGLFVQFKNENYDYPNAPGAPTLTGKGQGIKEDSNLTVGPSVDYRPSDDLNLHLFYTFERIFFDNTGNGACSNSNVGACLGSAGYYRNQYTSDVHTVGVSSDWQITDKLKLGAEYSFGYGSVMFSQYNGVFVAAPTASYQNVSNYPDINSMMHDVRLTAIYEVLPQVDLLLQGTWSYYNDDNWYDKAASIQSAGSNTISILTPGYSSPNYSVFTVMAGMKFSF